MTTVFLFKKIRPDIPVILCTGFSAMIDENKALAEKVQAFVLKPLPVYVTSRETPAAAYR
jgi:CheY-like chemotaxis protein